MRQAAGGHESVDFSTAVNKPELVVVEALARVQAAYASFFPRDADASRTFFEKLRGRVVHLASAPGMTWERIGDSLWTPLMLQLDAAFDAYRSTMIAAPSLDAETWLRESQPLMRKLMLVEIDARSEQAAAQAAAAITSAGPPRTKRAREAALTKLRSTPAQTPTPTEAAKKAAKKAKDAARKKRKREKASASLKDAEASEEAEADDEAEQPLAEDRARAPDKSMWVKTMPQLTALQRRLKTKERLCSFYYSSRGCRHVDPADCAFTHDL